jgi:cell pole-organizing protein PopZ
MEDAVADLFRPLLKTWLAENMPKIVERALRREMSERLLPGQKSPQD